MEPMSYRWSVFGWPLEGVPKTDQITSSSDPAAGTVYTRVYTLFISCLKIAYLSIGWSLG